MSAFWTAVASERALVIAPYPGTHGFEVAYEWASFNATAAHNYTGWEGGLPLLLCTLCSSLHCGF